MRRLAAVLHECHSERSEESPASGDPSTALGRTRRMTPRERCELMGSEELRIPNTECRIQNEEWGFWRSPRVSFRAERGIPRLRGSLDCARDDPAQDTAGEMQAGGERRIANTECRIQNEEWGFWRPPRVSFRAE